MNRSTAKTGMGTAVLLLISSVVFVLLAVVSAAQQNIFGVLVWGMIAAVQWGGALRTPGFTFQKARHYGIEMSQRLCFPYWRLVPTGIGAVLGLIAFLLAWNNEFTEPVLICWTGAALCLWIALGGGLPGLPSLLRFRLTREWIGLAVILLVGGLVLYVNLYDFPHDMISDHVEYVLDAMRVQAGARDIYFDHNSGREPLFIYLAALDSYFFDGTSSYMSLKFVSASAAFLMLPALYFLGRQAGGKVTGLCVAAIGSVCLWTVIMGRLGFRVMLGGLAAALLLLTFQQALKSGRRRNFVLTGLILGLGQYGYSSFRIAPVVVLLGLFLYSFRFDSKARRELLFNGLALIAMALVAFIPLLSFALHFPDVFWSRTNNLVGVAGLDLVAQIFKDLIASLLMFNFGSDPVPLNIIQQNGHVLSSMEGILFLLGLLLFVWRGLRQRSYLFLTLAFLVLLLPSALAVGAPLETPSARRAITALPIVVLMAGSGLAFIVQIIYRLRYRHSHALAYGLGCIALLYIGVSNLTAYVTQYPITYYAPPNREMAQEIAHFEAAGGRADNVYLIFGNNLGWVDPRAVSIWYGKPEMNHVVLSIDSRHCLPEPYQPLMVLLSPNDTDDYHELVACYPNGQTVHVETPLGATFDMFFVRPLLTPSGQMVFQ